MKANMDDLVHLRLTGQMVDLLLDIDQDKYATFVTQAGKEKVFYAELIKAIWDIESYEAVLAPPLRQITGVGV
jgi:hypothetical protein